MVLPLASFNLTSSANIENASEHASSQSRPQRKSLPIACAGYVFASEKTKPSLRCNRSFPIGPLPDRKSSIHSMCSESSMLHAAPMFDIIPQIHQTRIVANLPRGKKRGCGGNVSAACEATVKKTKSMSPPAFSPKFCRVSAAKLASPKPKHAPPRTREHIPRAKRVREADALAGVCQKAHPAKAALAEEWGEERILYRDFFLCEPFYLVREDDPLVPDVAVEVVGL